MWGTEPNVFVVDRLSGLDSCRVLDLGCGQGRNAIWLAQQGHEVTALDVSDVAVAQAADVAAELGAEVEFISADLQAWEPVPETFDLVLLAYVQAPPGVREELHAKARRALAPAGSVFIVAHHSDNLEEGIGGPPMPEVLFNEELLAADFAGMDVVENARVLRHVERDDVVGDAIDIVFIGRRVS